MTVSDTFSGKTILITGGAGFIGSHLCSALVEAGADVRCLDNFITGKEDNIKHLTGYPCFKLIEGDIRDERTCLQAINGVDVVLHQAALGSVPRSVDDPITTTEINVLGSLNIFKVCCDEKVRRVVYASSSSVYGDDPGSPKLEDRTGSPLSPYAASKKTVEMYAHIFSSLFGLPIIGLRYFNVFGPRQDPEGAYAAAIPRFINAALNEQTITVFGDGTQTRDFTYVDNVVHANLLAAKPDLDTEQEIMNIACSEAISVNTVIQTIGDQLISMGRINTLPEVHYTAPRPGEIKHSLAATDRSTQVLGYKPVCNFNDGIKAYLDWYCK